MGDRDLNVGAVVVNSPQNRIMLPDELTTTSSFRVQEGKVVDPSQRKGRIMSRRHSVGFKPETDMQVVEFEMYDEETREVFWYSKDEYDIIKARNR